MKPAPALYLGDGHELHVERRSVRARRESDRHVRRYFCLLGAVILVLITIVIVQRWHYVKRVEAMNAPRPIEHRVDRSERDEAVGTVSDPENRWLCRHIPAVRM